MSGEDTRQEEGKNNKTFVISQPGKAIFGLTKHYLFRILIFEKGNLRERVIPLQIYATSLFNGLQLSEP